MFGISYHLAWGPNSVYCFMAVLSVNLWHTHSWKPTPEPLLTQGKTISHHVSPSRYLSITTLLMHNMGQKLPIFIHSSYVILCMTECFYDIYLKWISFIIYYSTYAVNILLLLTQIINFIFFLSYFISYLYKSDSFCIFCISTILHTGSELANMHLLQHLTWNCEIVLPTLSNPVIQYYKKKKTRSGYNGSDG